MATTNPRSWYRHLRFSLRGMLVVVVLIGGGLGSVVRSVHNQRDAVRVIEPPGHVTYDRDLRSGRGPAKGGRFPPDWLVARAGVDYFFNVVRVDYHFGNKKIDDVLNAIAQLERVETLDVDSLPVTNAGLARLKGLTRLRILSLEETGIDDEGLAHLKELDRLEELRIGVNNITRQGAGKCQRLRA